MQWVRYYILAKSEPALNFMLKSYKTFTDWGLMVTAVYYLDFSFTIFFLFIFIEPPHLHETWKMHIMNLDSGLKLQYDFSVSVSCPCSFMTLPVVNPLHTLYLHFLIGSKVV